MLGRERRRDPRLEHAVAPGHPADARIEDRPVQRVGDGPHEPSHGAPGQPRVGVERDHVPDARRWDRRGPARCQDAGRRRAAQEGIELEELAALALPADPATLGLVPASAAVEEQEPGAAARGVAVALVEPVDRGRRGREELVIAGNVLGRGVEPVREQGEPDVTLAVGEVVHLEAARPGPPTSASLERSIGTTTRVRSSDRHAVSRSSRGSGFGPSTLVTAQLTSATARSEAGASARMATRTTPMPAAPAYHDSAIGTARSRAVTRQGSRVARRRPPDVGTAQPHARRHPGAQRPLELEAPVADQVVAGVRRRRRAPRGRRAVIAGRRAWRATSISVRPAPRASTSMACRYRSRVAKSISANRLPACRISSTTLTLSTNWAQSNHEIRRMLVITLRTVTFIVAWRWCSRRTISSAVVPSDARSSSSQRSGRGDRRVLVAEALEELDPRGGGERRRRETTRGRSDLRSLGAQAQQAIGEQVRPLAGRPALHDLLREAAEVLDEEDPQADRDRPQLADGQRLHRLVGADHAPKALRVEAAVGVGDVRPGKPHDARVALEVAVGQLRELPVVVRGKVVADLAQLLVDDREVVDQPLGRRRDRPLVLDRLGQGPVRRPAGRGRSRRCAARRGALGEACS